MKHIFIIRLIDVKGTSSETSSLTVRLRTGVLCYKYTVLMYRLVKSNSLLRRSLQSGIRGAQIRPSLLFIMDSKQQDIPQPIGKQPQENVKNFTTISATEG